MSNGMRPRSPIQKVKDFITFPLRAVSLFVNDKWGLSSLKSERFDYVAREVKGYCLDVGCGRGNRFVKECLNGRGVGIDVFEYEGLTPENVVEDITHFPFADSSFDSVTLIANFHHIPKSLRDLELAETYRCLKPKGNIIVTVVNPVAGILVHKLVELYSHIFKIKIDEDCDRGMHEEESYYVTHSEVVQRLQKAKFQNLTKKYFLTQWGLNHLVVGWK